MYSNYTRNKLIDHVHGKTSFTMPADAYIGLFTTFPTDPSDAGTEMTGGSYARTQTNASWAAASGGSGASNAAIQITATTGTVVGWGIFDAATSGNLLEYDYITASVSLEANTFATSGEGTDTITLAHGNIRNVVVKDNPEVTTYVQGTDYEVEKRTGKVTRISTGAISSGDTVKVSYDYNTTRTVAVDGDVLQFNSGNLKSTFTGS